MMEEFEDQVLEGLMDCGTWVELCRWSSEGNEYDALGWLDHFGDRVGSGTARLPDQSWADLTKFSIVRPVTRAP